MKCSPLNHEALGKHCHLIKKRCSGKPTRKKGDPIRPRTKLSSSTSQYSLKEQVVLTDQTDRCTLPWVQDPFKHLSLHTWLVRVAEVLTFDQLPPVFAGSTPAPTSLQTSLYFFKHVRVLQSCNYFLKQQLQTPLAH